MSQELLQKTQTEKVKVEKVVIEQDPLRAIITWSAPFFDGSQGFFRDDVDEGSWNLITSSKAGDFVEMTREVDSYPANRIVGFKSVDKSQRFFI